MTYLKDKIVIWRGKHRLVDRVTNLAFSLACQALASRVVLQGGAKRFDPNTRAELESLLFPIDVWLPVSGVIEVSMQNRAVDYIAVIFAPKSMRTVVEPRGTTSTDGQSVHWVKGGLHTVTTNIMSPIFVEFFETHKPWIKDKFGKVNNWPPVFSFGRVIRNALSSWGETKHERSQSERC